MDLVRRVCCACINGIRWMVCRSSMVLRMILSFKYAWTNCWFPMGIPRAETPSLEKGISLGRSWERTVVSVRDGEYDFPLSSRSSPSMWVAYRFFHFL